MVAAGRFSELSWWCSVGRTGVDLGQTPVLVVLRLCGDGSRLCNAIGCASLRSGTTPAERVRRIPLLLKLQEAQMVLVALHFFPS